ncbi:MAG: c-type cytochrome [Chloroflexi bacterium]|nr:c-type cytochrome [Chloroflexota bacterium]
MSPEDAAKAMSIYTSKGCVACHGAQGWGSSIAPPVMGVSLEEAMTQMRNPEGTMPRFGPEMLSDADMRLVASYTNSLQLPTMTADLKMHIVEAREAAETKNKAGAELHLREALKVTPAELKGSLEFILKHAVAGEMAEVEDYAGMLVGTAH